MTNTVATSEDVSRSLVEKLVRSGDWLDVQDFPVARYALEGIIPEGMGLLVGPPKVGKSWLTLGVLLSIALGNEALGMVATGPSRPVLYLALEDGDRRMQDRCRRLLDGESIPTNFHYATRVHPGEVDPLVREWLHLHATADLRPLIVVDTLAKITRGATPGESAYARDYRVAGALKALADDFPGITLLLVHHTRKMASEDFVDQVSGTNGLAGAADFVCVLTRGRTDDSGVLSVTGRDVPENEYALKLIGVGRWQIDGNGLAEAADRAVTVRAATGLGDRSADIVAYVAQHPEGVMPKDVADALTVSNDDAGKYLRRLAKSGRIDSPKRGTYAPVRSVRVSESDDAFGHSDGSDTHTEDDK